MRKRTWFMLLLVMVTVSLLVFTGCPNDTTPDDSVVELFSFNAVGLTGTAIYSTDGGDNWTTSTTTNTSVELWDVAFEK